MILIHVNLVAILLVLILVLLIPGLSVEHLPGYLHLLGNLLSIFTQCSYFTYFLSSDTQATPGQRLLNICTVKVDKQKIDLCLAFDRTISQFFFPALIYIPMTFFKERNMLIDNMLLIAIYIILGLLILLNLLWYLIACFSEKKQTFHDILFNTVVVVTKGSS
ncbi:hypothetical protein BIY23_03685 [Wolbachia pipientis]|uniref:RDD domain-containing protein n=1 Tax=Wolbachia pipientis TaxID=955 RepID=A0A1E7QJ88_WOLPI|nr:hypothetical protein BIY23_03685 [Wolbachia pipientis]